jgi:hypothetical protein
MLSSARSNERHTVVIRAFERVIQYTSTRVIQHIGKIKIDNHRGICYILISINN